MTRSIRLYWGLLREYLRPHWPKMVLLTFLIFAGTGMELAAPQFIRQFIDSALERDELGVLYVAAALFLVLGLSGHALMGVAT